MHSWGTPHTFNCSQLVMGFYLLLVFLTKKLIGLPSPAQYLPHKVTTCICDVFSATVLFKIKENCSCKQNRKHRFYSSVTGKVIEKYWNSEVYTEIDAYNNRNSLIHIFLPFNFWWVCLSSLDFRRLMLNRYWYLCQHSK